MGLSWAQQGFGGETSCAGHQLDPIVRSGGARQPRNIESERRCPYYGGEISVPSHAFQPAPAAQCNLYVHRAEPSTRPICLALT